MIYKRFGNPHVKLWNEELINLFKFSSLAKDNKGEEEKSKDRGDKSSKIEAKVIDDIDQDHLHEIMTKKVLIPIEKIAENVDKDPEKMNNPILQKKPISIETALIFGEQDRYYNVINPDKIDESKNIELDDEYPSNEVVGIHCINIEYDNDPCSMILFRNWTNNFKFQFAKTQVHFQEMISSSVSQAMLNPIDIIMAQLEKLNGLVGGIDQAPTICK